MAEAGPADENLAYPRGGHQLKTEFESYANGDTEGTTDQADDNSDKRHLLDFIQLYESLPCLWNPGHPEYMKKPRRLAALQRLVPVLGRLRKGATEADVRRKINTLRCNYKKEANKIEESRRGGGKLYEPSSWVFHRLHRFLREIEPPPPPQSVQPDGYALSNDSLLSYAESEGATISCSPDPFALMSTAANYSSADANYPSADANYPSADGSFFPSGGGFPQAVVKKSSGKRAPEDGFKKVRLSSESFDRSQDFVPTIARAWGERLETLDPHQRLLAEKAINDVLFEASMGTLRRGYVHEFVPRGDPLDHNSEIPRN